MILQKVFSTQLVSDLINWKIKLIQSKEEVPKSKVLKLVISLLNFLEMIKQTGKERDGAVDP